MKAWRKSWVYTELRSLATESDWFRNIKNRRISLISLIIHLFADEEAAKAALFKLGRWIGEHHSLNGMFNFDEKGCY